MNLYCIEILLFKVFALSIRLVRINVVFFFSFIIQKIQMRMGDTEIQFTFKVNKIDLFLLFCYTFWWCGTIFCFQNLRN